MSEGKPHRAIVEKFGKQKLCRVTAYGEPQSKYTLEQILWVERGESLYAMPHYKPPFCVLYREDWLWGKDVDKEKSNSWF